MAVQVAVCGPGDCTEREWDHAWETGRLLAARGTVVGVLHAADPAAAVEATGLFGR